MTSKGIRISDKVDRVVSTKLHDILEEIYNGNAFHWSILEIDAIGYLGGGGSYNQLEKDVQESINGYFITWGELNVLSRKFHQIIWITIIGCKDESLLCNYENDQEMYETCDIVIEVHDSCFWEVFSKDINLINRLAEKFKDIQFLETDCEK